MKKFSTTQIKLLSCLADGLCHTGNNLGEALHISRTAIWKHVKQLIDLGLPILPIHQQGYRLTAPLILLNEQTILEQLNFNHFAKPVDFHMYATIDSTNRLLKELSHSAAIEICCAEMQTAGRGRFGRQWYSPFGENIYCSSRWHFDCDLSRLSGLSLVVSLAILAACESIGIRDQLRVKWPNDILWQNKKLCGNLIEVIAESNGGSDIVIGIGLNVNSSTTLQEHKDGPDKPWCSLFDITQRYTDRNLLIASLILHLDQFLNVFISQGFTAFMAQWDPIDYLQGNMITVSQPSGLITGRASGVNDTGQLILIDDAAEIHYLSSGDTSLHTLI